jgi:nucleoside-diphosphate-sugar epimerase
MRLAGRRVVVTGASGFIGSHLVERLAVEGAVVGALSRGLGRLAEIADRDSFTFLPCDLTDAREARAAIGDFAPEILFHFASQPDARESFEHTSDSMEVNVIGTLNAVEALRAGGGTTVIYGDSCKVYGGHADVPYREATPTVPNSSYAISKLAGWQICQLYSAVHGLVAVTARPTLIHGPRQGYNLITFVVDCLLRKDSEISLDGGSQTRDPLFIADAVDALVAIAERAPSLAGRVINLGGGRETSVEELTRLIVQLAGGCATVACRPRHARVTEMWRSYCDNAEAESMLGWQPRTSLAAGLEQTITYLISQRAQRTGNTP